MVACSLVFSLLFSLLLHHPPPPPPIRDRSIDGQQEPPPPTNYFSPTNVSTLSIHPLPSNQLTHHHRQTKSHRSTPLPRTITINPHSKSPAFSLHDRPCRMSTKPVDFETYVKWFDTHKVVIKAQSSRGVPFETSKAAGKTLLAKAQLTAAGGGDWPPRSPTMTCTQRRNLKMCSDTSSMTAGSS